MTDVGGEGPLTPSVLTARNYIYTAALEHRALLVAAEHRFYGQSYPTPDMSLPNLRYLTSEQALADLARMHDHISQTWPLTDEGGTTSKWIAFGGSYPGSLAAWYRLKYPTQITGSIASSAPILAQVDFREYMEVVGKGLRTFGGGACYRAVTESLDVVHRLLTDTSVPHGHATIEAMFHPCYPMTNERDISVFEGAIMGAFQDVAQYNGLRGPNVMTLDDVCDIMTAGPNVLDQLAKFIGRAQAQDHDICVDSKFEGEKNATIDVLMERTFDGHSSSRQWFYQTCNEFGYFQTSASPHSPFTALASLSLERVGRDICERVFNITVSPDVVSTNINYGGLDIGGSDITFPSGNVDPWHVLAVQNTTSLAHAQRAKRVFIHGTAHCADMYAPKANDSSAMQWAHREISTSIASYLSSSTSSSSTMMIHPSNNVQALS